MPPPPEGYSWKSLESAPPDEDITLQVTDGRGKPYVLVNACRLTAAGWVSSGKGTPLRSRRWRGGDFFRRAAVGLDDHPAVSLRCVRPDLPRALPVVPC